MTHYNDRPKLSQNCTILKFSKALKIISFVLKYGYEYEELTK